MSHHVPSPRRRTPVIAALHASLPVTRKARAAVAADALDAPGAPAKQPPRQPPAATLAVAGEGNAWVELDVTALTQTWVADASQNHGLVLLQEAASGSVVVQLLQRIGAEPLYDSAGAQADVTLSLGGTCPGEDNLPARRQRLHGQRRYLLRRLGKWLQQFSLSTRERRWFPKIAGALRREQYPDYRDSG